MKKIFIFIFFLIISNLYAEEIKLENLCYWNVDLQEAYFSPIEANERFKNQKQ